MGIIIEYKPHGMNSFSLFKYYHHSDIEEALYDYFTCSSQFYDQHFTCCWITIKGHTVRLRDISPHLDFEFWGSFYLDELIDMTLLALEKFYHIAPEKPAACNLQDLIMEF